MCFLIPEASGTVLVMQVPGDCQRAECDGMGGVAQLPDDTDAATDNIQCTDDICLNGMTSHPPVTTGAACSQSGGRVCATGTALGTCVECNANGDCPPGAPVCSGHTCIMATCNDGFLNGNETAIDCGGPDCAPCSNGAACTLPRDCDSGVCSGANCADCAVDAQCVPGKFCDAADSRCKPVLPNGTACGRAAQCATACVDGVCCDAACTGVCAACTAALKGGGLDGVCGPIGSGADPQSECATQGAGTCGTTGVCDGTGACQLYPAGTSCAGAVCTSPSFVGPSQCNGLGTCVAPNAINCAPFVCTTSGCLGSCLDDGDCTTGNFCNGGTCEPTRVNGAPCSANNQCVQGQCVDGVCCDSACNGVCQACNVAGSAGMCSPVPGGQDPANECPGATNCNGTGGCALVGNGGVCSFGGECTSTQCVDGVCCNTACNGMCLACNVAGNAGACSPDNAEVPPSDNNECTLDVCSGGAPYVFVPSLTPVTSQVPGDCQVNVCNGAGGIINVPDDVDLPPADGNECTLDLCLNGVPYVPVATGVPVSSQAPGDCRINICNGGGGTSNVPDDTDLPPNDGNECTIDLCLNGAPYIPVASGIPVSGQVPMDCQQIVCNGVGGISVIPDNTDIHDDGLECTQNLCSGGAMLHPPEPAGFPCATGFCDGNGACVQCNAATDCPGSDTSCSVRTCTAGVCGFMFQPFGFPGSPALAQTPGDCQSQVCDGSGGVTTVNDNADLPNDSNECTVDTCTAGVPSFPNAVIGSSCSVNGNTCDGAGACIRTFMVTRMGDGSAILGSAATPVFVEERRLDGSLLTVPGNPVALPTTVAGANARLTNAGSSTSEGNLSRSLDGRFVVLAGYDAAVGTAAVASSTTAAVNRVIGRVGRTGGTYTLDTSTRFTTAFSTSNVRSACTTNGVDLWASGTGAAGVGGIWYAPLGNNGAGVQVLAAPNNTRFCHTYFGQLFGSASSSPFFNVFTVGTGAPTTSGQTATVLAGLPNVSGPSVYSFALLDLNSNGVPDVLYVADDRTAVATGGIYKYTSADGVNWVAGTPALTNVGATNGARGLAAYAAGGSVTLVASTTSNSIALAVDPLTGAAMTVSNLVTAPVNTAFRGVALGIQ